MLDDLLHPNLLVVFCGTAAGNRSAALRQYYAGRGNRFWSILAETKLTPRQLASSEYGLLLRFGIGLTDLAKGQSGGDSSITFRNRDRALLQTKILQYQPRYLCFNGKRAAQEFYGANAVSYGLQPEPIGPTRVFVAPSTSGAARAAWDKRIWDDLAERVRRARAASLTCP